MKLVVGIGNPGKQYMNTRHNIGFQILDKFAEKHKINFIPAKSDFWIVESMLDAFPFFLVKPTTYVNNTGVVVNEFINENDIDVKDLLIISDDTNLDLASIRIRKSGGDGGHNGIKSIIYNLESENFSRLRIGVSKPENIENLANYVLSDFSEKENLLMKSKEPFIIELIEKFIVGGTNNMLNHFSIESQTNSSKIS